MAFLREDPVRAEIVVKNKIEQVNRFHYLGCNVFYDYDRDMLNE